MFIVNLFAGKFVTECIKSTTKFLREWGDKIVVRFLRKQKVKCQFFVCCLLITIAIPAILVEGTRIKAAQTQIESALDISAKSALANYNYLLKELYGLMALSSDDPDLLMEEIIYYLERNLMVEGIKEHKQKRNQLLTP